MKARLRSWRALGLALGVAAVGGSSHAAPAGWGKRLKAPAVRQPWLPPEPAEITPLTPTSWVLPPTPELRSYQLPREGTLRLLDRFTNPSQARTAPQYEFWYGRYGFGAWREEPPLQWAASSSDWAWPGMLRAEERLAHSSSPNLRVAAPVALQGPSWRGPELLPADALFSMPEPRLDLLQLSGPVDCQPWDHMKPVTLGRFGAEQDTFVLISCDGSVDANALDRLSVIARPPGVDHPGLPLPLEPSPKAKADEWVPGIKLLHPRLVWLVQKVALAFPGRPIYVVSGYRPDGHTSHHKKGRALDMFVMGVPNEDLFAYCRKLHDVGCGYYPHHQFVHMDVRALGSGHPLWIDASGPGQASRYVDSWPGVVDGGALDWAGGE